MSATGTKILDGMLAASGLPRRASYNKIEVCLLLHISERTFWRYVCAEGRRAPWMLESFKIRGHYRISYDALAAWLARNQTCARTRPDDPYLP
jgi:hypothetical protein